MLEHKTHRQENMRNGGVTLVRYIFVTLALVTGLAVVYAATVRAERAAHEGVLPVGVKADAYGTSRQAVLRWMKENSAMPEEVLAKIYRTAANNADGDLILAICLVESHFNPRAESDKGAMGLMGIMPTVWLEELKEHGIVTEKEDLYAIQRNINSGIYVLTQYLAQTHNLAEALSRYAGRDPGYAKRVLRALAAISRVRRSEERLVLAGAEGRWITATSEGFPPAM